ncbi:MAG TPA: hypothetical protein VE999_12305 [Gemmataceae bacterium]|nr:hypothetical protein [Gemmataceae bacterium]
MTDYVSGTALAVHLGCTRETVNDYVAKKIIKRAANGKYDKDDCRLKVLAHLRSKAGKAGSDALTAERVALTAAKRRREERQDQLEAGKLVPLEPIVRFLQAGLLPIRNRLLNLAGELAFLLAGRDQIECFETIDAKVREALEEISSADFAERAAKAGLAAAQSNRSSQQNGENNGEDDAE